VARLAGRQFGVVSRRQLLAAGLSRGAVDGRVAAGRLIVVHRGVYAVGHGALEPRGIAMAAVLACGAGAVVSHGTAAALWKILPATDGATDVTVPHRTGLSRPGLVIHRTRHLPRRHTTRLDGIPLTSPARTLLDLAESLPSAPLVRAVNEAEVLDLTTRRQLRTTAGAATGRRGAARITRLLADDVGPTRSHLEDRVRALLKAARLPQPRANARVDGMEVDLLWPAHRLIVEVDGWGPHRTKGAFERDRRKTLRLQSSGHTVVRIAWAQIRDEPFELVASLARLLAHSAASSHQ
jgi:very-short-patch-repair endonuclease